VLSASIVVASQCADRAQPIVAPTLTAIVLPRSTSLGLPAGQIKGRFPSVVLKVGQVKRFVIAPDDDSGRTGERRSFEPNQVYLRRHDGRRGAQQAHVIAFYDLMFNLCRPREAIERYAGLTYIQHNPGVASSFVWILTVCFIPTRAAGRVLMSSPIRQSPAP
jgi:hypothetical protein